MAVRIGSVLCLMALACTLTACGPSRGATPQDGPTAGGGGGVTFAPGLYKLPDGSASAYGTLDYRDLEGGMWVILDDAGKTVAVIANPENLGARLGELKGGEVVVNGRMTDGVSVRTAGPEIQASSIEKFHGGAPAGP